MDMIQQLYDYVKSLVPPEQQEAPWVSHHNLREICYRRSSLLYCWTTFQWHRKKGSALTRLTRESIFWSSFAWPSQRWAGMKSVSWESYFDSLEDSWFLTISLRFFRDPYPNPYAWQYRYSPLLCELILPRKRHWTNFRAQGTHTHDKLLLPYRKSSPGSS